MGDPLFTPALVGYLVSAFFTEVVSAAKSAYGHKEKCQKVLESVNKLQSRIDEANQHSANWEDAQLDWLKEINDLLDKARGVATKGLEETKPKKLKRAMSAWHWRKKPSELLKIVRQIEEAKGNVVFCAALHSYLNASKPESVRDFVPQDVSSCIVGVDEPFRKLKQSILAAPAKDTPSILGLHGKGGSGKTLVAQRLHNDKDIREMYGAQSIMWVTVGHDAIVCDRYKQMATLLNDKEFEKTYGHQSLEDQRTYLLNVLSKKQVFLILDDLWQENCEKNREMIYWLNIAGASGSATLLTSRNTTVISRAVAEAQSRNTTVNSRVHADAHVVESLSDEESWRLFSFHAFLGRTLPSTISEKTARDVCNECKGLPLALKVIGSAMMDKAREDEWGCVLYDLKRAEPIAGSTEETEMFGRLRLSYDMLKEDALKTCFLYSGAFPEDHKIPTEKLFDIWISEGLFGLLEKKVARQKAMEHLGLLEKRSLIYWNQLEAYVQVHDVLRDLALYIIDKAKYGECAYECYFQTSKVVKSFPSREHLHAIRRMSFMNSDIHSLQQIDFEVLCVEVLLLSNVIHNEEQREWLDFKRFEALRYLELSNDKSIQGLPTSIGELKSLTALNISYCPALKELPTSIGELKSLTTLYLRACRALKELPRSIGKLNSLTMLSLLTCSALKELPASIGELKSLMTLYLGGCRALKELPTSIGKLKSLTTSQIYGCSALEELPTNIGELKSLTTLYIFDCSALKEFPTSTGELKSLTTLLIFGCSILKELPTSIGDLKSLMTLRLRACSTLKELSINIGELKSLTTLDISHCSGLKELPTSIGKLNSLKTLDISHCSGLKELPTSIGELKFLTTIKIYECSTLEELPTSIGELKSLKTLHLRNCRQLKELSTSIGELKSLTTLCIYGCSALKELPTSIGKLKSLMTLHLHACPALKEIPTSIGELNSMTSLDISHCFALKQLPTSIGKLNSLTTISHNGKLIEFDRSTS